nr:cytochrome c oxidase subunit II [Yoda sp. d ASH-2021]
MLFVIPIKHLAFQDAVSPSMEELIYFHDFSMIITTAIIALISYGLAVLMSGFSTNRFLLNTQTIETLWTITPMCVLISIGAPSLRLLYLMDELNDPHMTVNVIGHQWYWAYEYPDYPHIQFDSFLTPLQELIPGNPRLLEVDTRLIIPTHSPIRALVTSSDVIHAWSIPSLGINIDAVPGRLNQVSLYSSRSGVHYGQCSEICGAYHSFMPIVIESIPLILYEDWVRSQ